MKLNSHNEWDRLKTVVVGTVEGFCPGVEIEAGGSGELDAAVALARTAYPQWYMDEVAEDLDDLCGIFRTAGVTVLRPQWTEASPRFSTPNWAAAGYDIYNVRDLNAVFGDTLVASASPARFRLFETYALRDLLYANFFDDGFRWLSAPLPKLRGEYIHEIQRAPTPLETVEDTLHQQKSRGLHEVFHYLDEDEIIFDAANIIRLGRDILFLVSSTGNRKAVKWLQGALGAEYRVHITHAYRSSHLDSTIAPLRPGFVLLNGARVNEQNCPDVIDGWEKLFFTDVAPVPESEVEFQKTVRTRVYEQLRQMGVSSSMNHVSSPWGGLNVFSLDPQTVLVHDRQTALIRTLESKGFTVVPVRMRHQYTMMGGLHCTTLDVMRESQ
jgi:glycine amidinotransferase/scyllo-inosamine-4-phosphate amidinotransferase 1